METTVFILWLLFIAGIYAWAESKGRSGIGWALGAFLFSPLLVGIILLFMSKTPEKKAEELKVMKDLLKD